MVIFSDILKIVTKTTSFCTVSFRLHIINTHTQTESIKFNVKHVVVAGEEQEILHYLVCVRWTFRSAASLVEDTDTGVTVGGVRTATPPKALGVTAIDARVDRIACS